MKAPLWVRRETVLTLHDQLLAVLPYLVEVLGQYDEANYLLEQKAA